MGNDAYELQGLNGWQLVEDGYEFAGRSRGFQVALDGTFVATEANNGAFAGGLALNQGFFVGGIITALTVSGGGAAFVFPMDSDYQITIVV
jgi:hypothetical protein